jgi:beta-lactam-binding protein with PASTA domain
MTPTDTVVAQMPPAANTLLRAGEGLGLLVSRGAQTNSTVPDVRSLETSAAIATIRAAGFTPRIVPGSPSEGMITGLVEQQFPMEGTIYWIGLPVLVYAPVPK